MMFRHNRKVLVGVSSLRSVRVISVALLVGSSAMAQVAPSKEGSSPSKDAVASKTGGEKDSVNSGDAQAAAKEEKKESALAEMTEEEKASEGEVKPWSAQEAKDEPAQKKATVTVAEPVEEKKETAKAAVVVVPKEQKVEEPPEPEIDYDSLPITYHQWRFDLGMGPRFNWITDSNFDLFSDSNVLTSFNLRGAGTVFVSQKMSVAVTGQWDVSGANGQARALSSSIALNRLLLGGEGRYHFLPRLAAYGRLEAGMNFLSSRLGEESAADRLELSSVQFAGALTAGAAFRVAGSRDGRERAFRAHLYLEGGFAYVSSADLIYEVVDGGPLRPEPVDLGSLSLGGPQVALGALVSF